MEISDEAVGVEVFGGIAAFVAHFISVNLVVLVVCHPYSRPVRPESPRRRISRNDQSVEVFGIVTALVAYFVGVEFAVRAVCHPNCFAIGPDAGWIDVPGGLKVVQILRGIGLFGG